MKEFNIVGNKNIFLFISGALVLAAVVAIFLFGFQLAVDFRGGTLWQFEIQPASATSTIPTLGDVQKFFAENLKISDAVVSSDLAAKTFLVRLPVVEEPDHQKYVSIFKSAFPGFSELSFQSIGPSVGKDLRTKSIWAIVLVLVGISLYIAFAFRKVSRPISSWKYGLITLVTLLHDVVIPAGFLAFLGYSQGVEIDGNFVVALLVIMGFSVHDTIVVFDRIRENLFISKDKSNFSHIVNQSINQTISRSVNTSLTLILVLIALYFVGPQTLSYFVLTLLIGVTLGVYSSIFVASPALLLINKKPKGRA